MKTPKAVVFDMDGVLSDSEWIYAEKILEVLREEGIYIEADEIHDLFGQSMLNICIELKKRYHLSEQAKYYDSCRCRLKCSDGNHTGKYETLRH